MVFYLENAKLSESKHISRSDRASLRSESDRTGQSKGWHGPGGVHPTHPDPARLKNIEISTKLDWAYRSAYRYCCCDCCAIPVMNRAARFGNACSFLQNGHLRSLRVGKFWVEWTRSWTCFNPTLNIWQYTPFNTSKAHNR